MENGQFGWGGESGSGESESEGKSAANVSTAFLHDAFSKDARGFYKLGVVKEDEGLEGCIGSFAARAAGVTAVGPENTHVGSRDLAFPVGVKAAAVKVVPGALLEGSASCADGVPSEENRRLVGVDPGSPLPINQEAADSEGMITNELGLQTLAWSTGKKAVSGIALSKQGFADTGLSVGGGGDDLVEEGLYVPIGFEKADS